MISEAALTFSLKEGKSAWDEHEFLDVEAAVGMFAAVYDIECRLGQVENLVADQEFRDIRTARLYFPWRKLAQKPRDAEDGVRAKSGLIFCAVKPDHRSIERFLVEFFAFYMIKNLVVDVFDSIHDSEAVVALFIAITKLESLVDAR